MLERGLLTDFSAAVRAEIDAIGGAAHGTNPSVRDLRSLLWASIDNDDSLDLDQLSVTVPIAGGAAKILVAVADVDAIVKKGSAIDGHARANTTSVYTAAENVNSGLSGCAGRHGIMLLNDPQQFGQPFWKACSSTTLVASSLSSEPAAARRSNSSRSLPRRVSKSVAILRLSAKLVQFESFRPAQISSISGM
jgi:hypothetical protein